MSRYLDHGQGTRQQRAAQHEARARELEARNGAQAREAAQRHRAQAERLRELPASACSPDDSHADMHEEVR